MAKETKFLSRSTCVPSLPRRHDLLPVTVLASDAGVMGFS